MLLIEILIIWIKLVILFIFSENSCVEWLDFKNNILKYITFFAIQLLFFSSLSLLFDHSSIDGYSIIIIILRQFSL